ncbi:MAG: hypothetical protein AB1545_14105 [Thermodesulfobacteriota bacterium]
MAMIFSSGQQPLCHDYLLPLMPRRQVMDEENWQQACTAQPLNTGASLQTEILFSQRGILLPHHTPQDFAQKKWQISGRTRH